CFSAPTTGPSVRSTMSSAARSLSPCRKATSGYQAIRRMHCAGDEAENRAAFAEFALGYRDKKTGRQEPRFDLSGEGRRWLLKLKAAAHRPSMSPAHRPSM